MLHTNTIIQKKVKKLSLVLLLPLMIQGVYAVDYAQNDPLVNNDNGQSRNTAIGRDANAGGTRGSVALGYQADAQNSNSLALGRNATASANNAQATGLNAEASGFAAIGMGTSTKAEGSRSQAYGWHAEAHSGQSIAIGSGLTDPNRTTAGEGNRGARSIAIGSGNATNGRTITRSSDSIAIGSGANTSQPAANAVAIGTSASVSAADSVALGSASVADEANTVSVGSAGSERRITNVANGTSNNDAVNFSQLNTAYNTGMALTGTTVSVTDGNGDVSVDLAALQTTQGTTNTGNIATNTVGIATT